MRLSELVKILSAELATCGDLEVLLENAEFKVSRPLNTNNLEMEVTEDGPCIVIRE